MRERAKDRSPRRRRISNLGLVVTCTVAGALLAVTALTVLLTRLVFGTWQPWTRAAEDLTFFDVAKISLAIVAGVGATQALVVAYRRQRLLEEDQTSLSSRFGEAASQLASATAAERLAGVYAMAALADEWTRQRQQCINVLCAYLRLPVRTDEGEDEVRMAVVDTISNRLNARRDSGWHDNNFHLDGATIPRMAHFENVVVRGWMSFQAAAFCGGCSFTGSSWSKRARFNGARFEERTAFSGATFDGGATFDTARFENKVTFSASTFGEHANFSGVVFNARAGFRASEYRGSATFQRAVFLGTANFNFAKFFGVIQFGGAEFLTQACFKELHLAASIDTGAQTFQFADFYSPDEVTWGPIPVQRAPNMITRKRKKRLRRIDAVRAGGSRAPNSEDLGHQVPDSNS